LAITITEIAPAYSGDLEALQRVCYPTLAPAELMERRHFLRHCKIFPEGNFVALRDGIVVGLSSGFLIDFDFSKPTHTFADITGNLWFRHHNPGGAFYYGADVSVHPRHRRLGIGSRLYEARKHLVYSRGLSGIVTGGLLPGYAHYRHLSVVDYVARVTRGELADPTMTFQLRHGFEVHGLIEGYIRDTATGGWAALMVWRPVGRHQSTFGTGGATSWREPACIEPYSSAPPKRRATASHRMVVISPVPPNVANRPAPKLTGRLDSEL
jgi:GNAT superfamily N-acetyltransferase